MTTSADLLSRQQHTRPQVGFVIHRYGQDIIGGAETHCRKIVEHMTKYWDITVLTTCAHSAVDWANHYPPGRDASDAKIRRFPVDYPRNTSYFNAYLEKLPEFIGNSQFEERWLRECGPWSSSLFRELQNPQQHFDFMIFYTYEYASTCLGLPSVSCPTLLIPTAHDSPQLGMTCVKQLFSCATGIFWNTVEEKQLTEEKLQQRFPNSEILGLGIDIPEYLSLENLAESTATQEILTKHELDKTPYILYIGRIAGSKGFPEAFIEFAVFREKYPHLPVKFVLIGPTELIIPHHYDILYLGSQDEETKWRLVSACNLLWQPSRMESLSLVLLEAWLCQKPVLVDIDCAATAGQVKRCAGGLSYHHKNTQQFHRQLHSLLTDKQLSQKLGAAGCIYAKQNYTWPVIEDKCLNWRKFSK